MIEFGCKNCGQKLSVQDQHSGKRVKCPKCGSICVVPDNSDKIKFNCKSCGQRISVPQIHAGKKGKCPKCKNPVVVPSLKREPADGAGTVSVVCSMCNEAVQVPETSRGQSIECPECGSYIETSSGGALSGSDASVPPRSDEDLYQEETEEYEESVGVDRRIIVGISAVAAVVVVGLIILAAVLRSSRSRPAERPEGLQGQQQLADGGAKMTIKLLDPGAQPRTALRYKFQANRTEKMVMEMSMAMAMEIGDQKQPETQVPATRMTMTIDSKEVSPEGNLHYEFELKQVEVLRKPGANPAMVNAMKQQTSRMLGLSGSATVTSRGFTKDAEIKPPPGIDPQIRKSMDEMKQSMKQMSVPLPEEPVGRDARWQVTMPVETPAMKLTQVATYTLSEIQGDKVKFDITIKQSAPPQEIDTPGAAPGVKVSLESLKSSGKGTVELQMTNLVPTSNINMTTTYVVSANNQKIKTTMRIGMKIHRERPTSAPPPKGRGCFLADTDVWVEGAVVHISKVAQGETVGKLGCAALTAPFGQIEKLEEHVGSFECRDIVLESGNRVSVVDAHCFMLDSGQWIAAQDLRNDLRLKTLHGTVSIKSVTTRAMPFVGKVYNLKIKSSDQYMVGKDGLIVRDY